MSDKNVKGKSKAELSPLQNKPKYESPTVVPLGEMAKGMGACTTGSSFVACGPPPGGAGPYTGSNCTPGTSPIGYCSSVGTNATDASASYCSAGEGAAAACTAGNCAQLGSCTNSGLTAGGAGTGACTGSGQTASAACSTVGSAAGA